MEDHRLDEQKESFKLIKNTKGYNWEIKAIKDLEDVHLAQAINYLEAYAMEIGLLINFGNTSLQFKRVMKPKNHSAS